MPTKNFVRCIFPTFLFPIFAKNASFLRYMQYLQQTLTLVRKVILLRSDFILSNLSCTYFIKLQILYFRNPEAVKRATKEFSHFWEGVFNTQVPDQLVCVSIVFDSTFIMTLNMVLCFRLNKDRQVQIETLFLQFLVKRNHTKINLRLKFYARVAQTRTKVLLCQSTAQVRSHKKNDIIWEFFISILGGGGSSKIPKLL